MNGKLIRYYLAEGKPSGLRTVEISNMTIYGTIFPRTKLNHFEIRDSASKPGVYILLGTDVDNPDQQVIYIGEGDPVLPRLKSHSSKKDFWTEAIVFTSKDDYLTKTQIQYLESELITQAKDAFRVMLDNGNSPAKPNISEVDRSEVEQFIDGIKLTLSALGYDFLEPRTINNKIVESAESSQKYELKNKDAFARMLIIDSNYVVLSGSTAVLENRPSVPESIKKLRKDLIASGIMRDEGNGVYTFTQDTTFTSPSYAAAAIVGGAANGRKLWKCGSKSLKELDTEQLKVYDED
jgi:hypothetical protein